MACARFFNVHLIWLVLFVCFYPPPLQALPYWGSPPERKVIRKYWNQKLLCKENAPFHILITSYQLVSYI